MRIRVFASASALALSAALAACNGNNGNTSSAPGTPAATHNKVIVFVWDGLRPDSINAVDTPRLNTLRTNRGVFFSDNHSTYPTFTMMNAASFATGAFPGTTGFYGNTLYQPGGAGKDSGAAAINFNAPVFTEDYGVLDALASYYQTNGSALLQVGTLFQAAQAAGLKTAAVGKSGAAYLQDYKRGGYILDERFAYPLELAQGLQKAGFALPLLTPNAYPAGTVTLASNNGNPTAGLATTKLADGVTVDPRSTAGSPNNAANEYLMNAYLNYILPTENPDLSLIWFRTPDSTEHAYGPGSPNYRDGLRSQDALLGLLLDKLDQLGLSKTTDVIIANDHGHSTVGGDPAYFPLRALSGNASDQSGTVVTTATDANGYSVSGDVRLADLLTRQLGATYGNTFFDGNGCSYDPVHSGIKADGTNVYPTQTDSSGSVCGRAGTLYTTPSYAVPATLPAGATVIAANGGSDYVYLPDHDTARAQAIVTVLQSRPEYGAVFVNSRYNPSACASGGSGTPFPGTLCMNRVNLESTQTSTPDIIASFNFSPNATTAGNAGVPGTEYESAQNNWGMHGSFGPRDVHNTLVAYGPDFKSGFIDTLPSGNVDVAPTVAQLLGITLPQANGRVLAEALAGNSDAYTVATGSITPATAATGLTIQNPTDPSGATAVAGQSQYSFAVSTKLLTDKNGKAYTYFDQAVPTRQ